MFKTFEAGLTADTPCPLSLTPWENLPTQRTAALCPKYQMLRLNLTAALIFGRSRGLLLNVDHDNSGLLPRLHISESLDNFFQGITAIKYAPEPAFCHQVCEVPDEPRRVVGVWDTHAAASRNTEPHTQKDI